MYILTFLTRTHSSGSLTVFTKCFIRLREASSYLQNEWYPEIVENWDEKDMRYNYSDYDDEDMTCPPPKKEDFSAEVLESKLVKKRQVIIHDPYSIFCALTPVEVILTCDK